MSVTNFPGPALGRVNGNIFEDGFGSAERTEALGRRALTIDPLHAPAHSTIAVAYAVRGDHAAVLNYANRAIELSPNFAPGHVMQGFALSTTGAYVGGAQALRRSLRLEPRAPSSWWSALGWMNYLAGRKDDAVLLWQRSVGPDMVYPRAGLAQHYESIGRHQEAQRLVQEILEINPELRADGLPLIFPMLSGGTGEKVIANLHAAGLP